MAGNGISINILADVREAVRGANDVSEAMEEVADTLHDLTKESGDTTDRMERDFKDLAQEADRQSDELRKKFRDAYKDVRRASDDTRDVAETNVRKMGDQSAEIGGEIRQNLGEGIANAARGDFESLGDTISDTLGGVAGTIGGIGTAGVAAAGALGIGALISAFQSVEEEQKNAKAAAGEYFDALVEGQGRVQESSILSGLQDLLTNEEKLAKAQQIRKATGLDLVTVGRALNGDLEDGKTVADALADANDRLTDAQKQNRSEGKSLNDGLKDQRQDLLKAKDVWNDYNGVIDDGASKWEVYSDAASRGAVRSAEAAVEAGKASKKVDEFGDTVYKLPDGKKLYVDAETGQATEDIETFNEIDLDTKKVKVGVKDETKRELDRILNRIASSKVNITVGAASGASIGGAIGRRYGARGQLG